MPELQATSAAAPLKPSLVKRDFPTWTWGSSKRVRLVLRLVFVGTNNKKTTKIGKQTTKNNNKTFEFVFVVCFVCFCWF